MVIIPCYVIVAQYFEKRRAKALAIFSTGCSLGGVALTPVTELLFSSFGYSGGWLILGGISLNCLAMACLFRPLEDNYPKRGQFDDDAEKEVDSSGFHSFEEDKPEKIFTGSTMSFGSFVTTGSVTNVNGARRRFNRSNLALNSHIGSSYLKKGPENVLIRSVLSITSISTSRSVSHFGGSLADVNSNSHHRGAPLIKHPHHASDESLESPLANNKDIDLENDLDPAQEATLESKTRCQSLLSYLCGSLDLHLLMIPEYLFYCIMNAGWSLCFAACNTFISGLATDIGFTDRQVGYSNN